MWCWASSGEIPAVTLRTRPTIPSIPYIHSPTLSIRSEGVCDGSWKDASARQEVTVARPPDRLGSHRPSPRVLDTGRKKEESIGSPTRPATWSGREVRPKGPDLRQDESNRGSPRERRSTRTPDRREAATRPQPTEGPKEDEERTGGETGETEMLGQRRESIA